MFKFSRMRAGNRKGAATIELAVCAPVFLALVVGVIETSRLFEVHNQLALAAREGARLTALDRAGVVPAGMTMNQKVEADVKAFLHAAGYDPNDITVSILSHDDPNATFDLGDPANDFKYFELHVKIPYSAFTTFYSGGQGAGPSSKIVFRNGRSSTD